MGTEIRSRAVAPLQAADAATLARRVWAEEAAKPSQAGTGDNGGEPGSNGVTDYGDKPTEVLDKLVHAG